MQAGGERIGAHLYWANDCPCKILVTLHDCFGNVTPTEKMVNNQLFDVSWNPMEPIEELFECLEEC